MSSVVWRAAVSLSVTVILCGTFGAPALAAPTNGTVTTTPNGTPFTASSNPNGCVANIQNPHYASSRSGIDASGTWKCADVTTTIQFNPHFVEGYSFVLWACGTKRPEQNIPWLLANCSPEGTNSESITLTKSNVAQTRTTPPLSASPAHGSGWWIATADWAQQGPRGTAEAYSYGNAVEVTG
jgi:hypothetical protein